MSTARDRDLLEDAAYIALSEALRPLGSLAVAFSGGVDSSLLLAVAARALGAADVTAVTAASELHPPEELERAVELARTLGVEHRVVRTHELDDEAFVANPSDRCYGCKLQLLAAVAAIAARSGRAAIADGTTVDDLGDHRPGMRAARERGVRHPLLEAGLGKTEVRRLSRLLALPAAEAPSQACLASRIPYGEPITAGKLRQVAAAEAALRALGFAEVRVRHYGALARVELPPAALERAAGVLREAIVDRLQELGWTYVTLDLAGLRSGSMNEVLSGEQREAGAART